MTVAAASRSIDEVMHRHVVVRYDGRYGRTTIRSSVVDVAVDADDVVTDVEVAAEVGHLFPLDTVTFFDDSEE